MKVAGEYPTDGIPMLVLETAKPQKFADTISEALGVEVETDAETQALLDAPQRVTDMPDDAEMLRAFITKHALHA